MDAGGAGGVATAAIKLVRVADTVAVPIGLRFTRGPGGRLPLERSLREAMERAAEATGGLGCAPRVPDTGETARASAKPSPPAAIGMGLVLYRWGAALNGSALALRQSFQTGGPELGEVLARVVG